LETEKNKLVIETINVSKNIKEIRNTFNNHGIEIDEIISSKPPFIVKWGITFFLILIFLFLLSSWLISYPDIIISRSRLIGFNAPKEIITKQEGKIIKIFTKNDSTIKEGEMIAWIEASVNHKLVIDLSYMLDSAITLLKRDSSEKLSSFTFNDFPQLGELQSYFQQFIIAYQQFNGFYQKKKKILISDLNGIKLTNENLQLQKSLTNQDIQLTQDGYKANEYLFSEKVISKQDLRTEKSKYLNKQLSIQQINALILSNEALFREKRKEIYDLEHSIELEKSSFLQALNTLKSNVEDWKRKFIITASVSGKIEFIIPLQENQYLKSGTLLGYVNPANSKFYAETYLPQNNFGKIRIEQNVQLRFDAYPYNEFGFVKGKLIYISNISTDSGFIAQIDLPMGLVTSHKNNIHYTNGLKADAVIITKNLRLIERLFYSLTKQISR